MIKKASLPIIALALLTSFPLISLTSCGGDVSISETISDSDVKINLEFNNEGGQVHYAQVAYKIGDKVKLVVAPNKGYSLAYVKVNNVKIRPVKGEYKFEIEQSENNVVVLFEKNRVIMSDFTFEFDRENHSATILNYRPDSRIVPYPFILPEKVSYMDESFDIVAIKKEAFAASNIEAIVLSKNIKTIDLETFSIVHGLTSINVDKDSPYFASFDDCLYSKDYKKLIAVPTEYLKQEINIKSGTEVIGESAFLNNRLIKKVNLPESVTSLEKQCFMEMSSLQTCNLSSKIDEIPCKSFANDNALKEISIPEGIKKIDEYAFNFCAELKKVSFPKSLKSIGKEAFYRCQKLREINFKEGLEVIGKSAFGSCISLTNLVMPNSLLRLEEAAFESCTNLVSCKLNDGLKYLGGAAFILTYSLQEIIIPKTVEEIGYNPFIGTGKAILKVSPENPNFKMENGVLYSSDFKRLICVPHGQVFDNNLFVIPNSVVEIAFNAFSMNLYLKKVVIPTSVKSMVCAFQEILPNQATLVYEMVVEYQGTYEEFKKIDFGGYPWNYKANFKDNLLICSDGPVSLEPQLG